ncbi:hypothetical protein SAMN05428981_11042 [Bacillus sp. OV194]|nr:hypothetical protein SAMN05428981_11042 [Bacillus sp. OV194]
MSSNNIPTWEEKEIELNDKLLMAQEISKMTGVHFRIINNGAKNGFVKHLIVGKDVQKPKGSENIPLQYAFPEKEIKKLKTWEQLEEELGCKLLSLHQVATKYLNMCGQNFNLLVNNGFYNDLCLKQWKDYFPYNKSIKYAFPEKWVIDADIKKRHDDLFGKPSFGKEGTSEAIVAQSRGITIETLRQEIESGVWDGALIYKKKSARGRYRYYLSMDKMIPLSRYHSLSVIAKALGYHKSVLVKYVKANRIHQPGHLKGTRLYDLEYLRKELPKIKEEVFEQQFAHRRERTPIEYLEEHQLALIDRYLNHRENYRPIKWEDKTYYKGNGIKKTEQTKKRMRSIIATVFMKMIINRCGVKVVKSDANNWRPSRNLNDLSDAEFKKVIHHHEKKEFLRDMLLTEEDIQAYHQGLAAYTIWHNTHLIKPFLYWLLGQIEKDYPLWRIDIEESREYFKKRQVLVSTLNLLPDQAPAKQHKEKLFLSRENIIKVYQSLINLNPTPTGAANKGLKYATMWMCSHFLGIRPEELHELRIEHFKLDDRGFLQTINKQGYGILDLPKEPSKQEISPSHPILKTLVVPQLVKLLNVYIEYLYEFQESRGSGYIFRPLNLIRSPERNSRTYNNQWMKNYRNFFDFLTPSQREQMKVKTGRHSLYNLFRKTGLRPVLEGVKTRAAEIQMRHDVFLSSGTTGEKYYMEDLHPKEYFAVVDEVLNYPWDLDELKKWEIEKGYSQAGTQEEGYTLYNNFDLDADDKSPVGGFSEEIKKKSPIIVEQAKRENRDEEKVKEEIKDEIRELEIVLQKLRTLSAKKLGVSPIERSRKIKETNERLMRLKQKASQGGEQYVVR